MSHKPSEPVHVAGTKKGEELSLNKKEPGRGVGKSYRTARDATGINAKNRDPILPSVMGFIPPA